MVVHTILFIQHRFYTIVQRLFDIQGQKSFLVESLQIFIERNDVVTIKVVLTEFIVSNFSSFLSVQFGNPVFCFTVTDASILIRIYFLEKFRHLSRFETRKISTNTKVPNISSSRSSNYPSFRAYHPLNLVFWYHHILQRPKLQNRLLTISFLKVQIFGLIFCAFGFKMPKLNYSAADNLSSVKNRIKNNSCLLS